MNVHFTSHVSDIAVEFMRFIFYIYSTINPPIPRGHRAFTSGPPKRVTGQDRGWGGQGGGDDERHCGGSDTGDGPTS